jgi:P-type Cu+ transporter
MSIDTGAAAQAAAATTTTTRLDLAVGGMTCASCAMRIERKLNKLDGVSASVNFATETATVTFDPGALAPQDLVAAIEATGCTARLPQPPSTVGHAAGDTDIHDHGDDDTADSLRERLLVCALLTVPVVLLAMVPVLQFRFWQWLSLTLAAPVIVWGA